MGTPSSFPPSDTLADEPVSKPRSIAQPSPMDFFEHEPLDHSQPSIRLLKMSSTLSAEGLIQCSISHTTTDHAPYRCLSYAWGEPEPRELISINGKSYYVQPNLFDFLKVTTSDAARTAHHYWVDALCIDQDNTAERNHQVMQMGRIYSAAEAVIAWLGIASQETVLHYRENPQVLDNSRYDFYGRETVCEEFAHNRYWTRAWITQELILARRISIAIGPLTLTIERLQEMLSASRSCGARSEEIGQIIALDSKRRNAVGEPLASLLLRFRDKRCSVARDRIFSLLALCSESDGIKVDYGCSIFELVHSIMKCDEHTLCVCSIAVIMESLAPEIGKPSGKEESSPQRGPYIEIDTNGKISRSIGKRKRCGILSHICYYAPAEVGIRLPRDATDFQELLGLRDGLYDRRLSTGISFAPIGPGLGRIRVSLWYLYNSYCCRDLPGKRLKLCSRLWASDGSWTSIRAGYGNWDINAPESLQEDTVPIN